MSKRFETKYLLDERKFNYLKCYIPTFLESDKFSQDSGYSVSSLYFDDSNLKAFYDKEEGELSKEKWRLRIYNNDLSTLRLEKKTKVGRISDKQIFSSQHPHGLLPKIRVHYRRMAFIENGLRVTLDSELSFDKARLASDIGEEVKSEYTSPVLLLEVKSWDEVLNQKLQKIILDLDLRSSAFSKYNEGMRHLYDL